MVMGPCGYRHKETQRDVNAEADLAKSTHTTTITVDMDLSQDFKDPIPEHRIALDWTSTSFCCIYIVFCTFIFTIQLHRLPHFLYPLSISLHTRVYFVLYIARRFAIPRSCSKPWPHHLLPRPSALRGQGLVHLCPPKA